MINKDLLQMIEDSESSITSRLILEPNHIALNPGYDFCLFGCFLLLLLLIKYQ